MKKWGLYEWSILLFFLIVPLVAMLVEFLFIGTSQTFVAIAFKWFLLSGVGLRLGGAGVKQIMQPQFTAKEIFNIESDGAAAVVRELGFANICFAVLAVISFFVSSFRIPAAITGGLYFGFAGLLHVFKPKDSSKEIFAMVSDLYIFFVLLILLILISL